MFEIIYKISRKSRLVNKIMRIVYKCEIPFKTQIGEHVTFNHCGLGVVIHPNAIIENNVHIEHHVCLGQRTGSDSSAPHIEENTVIGCYSVILGGVRIGEGSVIGAGSLVLEDVPPRTIYYNTRNIVIRENYKKRGIY